MNVLGTNEIVLKSSATLARDPIEVARNWLEVYGKVALATVVSTWGSAPVPVGSQLVVGPCERFQGSVSGGCVEGDVIAEAAAVLTLGKPRLMEFGVAEETGWRVGVPCAGRIRVLLEPLTKARDAAYIDRLLESRRARTPLAVTTNLVTGTRQMYEPGMTLPPAVASALASGQSQL